MNKERFEYLSELSIIIGNRYNYHYIVDRLFHLIGYYGNIPIYTWNGSRLLYDIPVKNKIRFNSGFDAFNSYYCGFKFKSICEYLMPATEYNNLSHDPNTHKWHPKEITKTDTKMWYYLLYKNNKEDIIIQAINHY